MKEGIEHILFSGSSSCSPQEDRLEEENERDEVVRCRPIRSEDKKTRRQRRKEREAKELVSHLSASLMVFSVVRDVFC